ncbi:MAG: protein kinase [Polyangiales bacterium]
MLISWIFTTSAKPRTTELYLVMEYLTGESLASQIAQGRCLSLACRPDILEQMTAALARAHDLGVVHRDLKSDNIMLTIRGGEKIL